MAQRERISARAIYEHGVLRPLTPMDLREGEEVFITIKTEERDITLEQARDMLRAHDDLAEIDDDELNGAEFLTEEELRLIAKKLAIAGSSRDWIDEEREDRV